jgi:hypothetical protein
MLVRKVKFARPVSSLMTVDRNSLAACFLLYKVGLVDIEHILSLSLSAKTAKDYT